jgi:hypothetical protein
MNKILLFLLLFNFSNCFAEINDEKEIGLYAIDCKKPDSGAVSINVLIQTPK